MAHMILDTQEELKNLFRRVRTFLRDTDKVIIFDEETFVGIFPFAPKDNVTVIEQKFREAFTEEFGGPPSKKRLFLFSATYPDDEKELTKLIDRLENGINNSMLIDSIKSPLNALTKTEIEHYKQKIRQYKKFF
jgi:GGDEF domain-containing protein